MGGAKVRARAAPEADAKPAKRKRGSGQSQCSSSQEQRRGSSGSGGTQGAAKEAEQGEAPAAGEPQTLPPSQEALVYKGEASVAKLAAAAAAPLPPSQESADSREQHQPGQTAGQQSCNDAAEDPPTAKLADEDSATPRTAAAAAPLPPSQEEQEGTPRTVAAHAPLPPSQEAEEEAVAPTQAAVRGQEGAKGPARVAGAPSARLQRSMGCGAQEVAMPGEPARVLVKFSAGREEIWLIIHVEPGYAPHAARRFLGLCGSSKLAAAQGPAGRTGVAPLMLLDQSAKSCGPGSDFDEEMRVPLRYRGWHEYPEIGSGCVRAVWNPVSGRCSSKFAISFSPEPLWDGRSTAFGVAVGGLLELTRAIQAGRRVSLCGSEVRAGLSKLELAQVGGCAPFGSSTAKRATEWQPTGEVVPDWEGRRMRVMSDGRYGKWCDFRAEFENDPDPVKAIKLWITAAETDKLLVSASGQEELGDYPPLGTKRLRKDDADAARGAPGDSAPAPGDSA
eukprot:TRINITY_DN1941_c0_g2_i2.p1 TRINITY_DN1941_c0_g2~~TRINITY_DN1941_c0_g2_i2.p1  ORF type:complete len:531 (+),score=154.71 TRINITY_DN1941_c0_g2_i2:81-1595(+)